MQQPHSLMPAKRSLLRGAWIAAGLWLAFLALTAYTSAATLLERVQATDVMRAATGATWQGRVTVDFITFLATQVVLHLCAGLLTWCLAYATAQLSGTARQKFGRMVVAWFCALAGATLAFNALWYPRTLIGAYYHNVMAATVGGAAIGQLVYFGVIMMGLATFVAAIVVTYRSPLARGSFRFLALTLGVVMVAGLTAIWPAGSLGAVAGSAQARPHVIVLGIDSLRLEQLRRFGGNGVTPNLDRFLQDADLFRDATTPAARTFSSWTAILTGRSPTVTGARFNLAARPILQVNPTVADVLRESGYRTVYSTDEVRFANIDESFGFEQVVTPRIGASDFILGTYNELPLASVVINTRIGAWLFPFSYGNRGAATMFHPETFVERIDREVSFDQPTLFISHLTAAHWPYYTGDTPFGIPAPTDAGPPPIYLTGLRTADRMFGDLVAMLKRKGALQNAIVIVLSDHGEAMGLPSDQFFDATFFVSGMRSPLRMLAYGHGQSVLSKSQYQVLLAFKSFGAGFKNAGRDLTSPVTVEDIAPTILDAAGHDREPLAATGTSVWPVLQSGSEAGLTQDRVRFTETDLAVLPAPGGGIDEEGTARANAFFFEVDRYSGRLQIRKEYAPLAIAYKERAAFAKDKLLAAIPAGPNAHQYIYFDFGGHNGELLLSKPGAELPEARRLWEALEKNYPGELKRPTAITREDWDRIAQEWNTFKIESPSASAGHVD